MRHFHPVKIVLFKERANITADISEITSSEAMDQSSTYLIELQDMAAKHNCTLEFKMEVTFGPINVRLYLIILGAKCRQVLMDILKD